IKASSHKEVFLHNGESSCQCHPEDRLITAAKPVSGSRCWRARTGEDTPGDRAEHPGSGAGMSQAGLRRPTGPETPPGTALPAASGSLLPSPCLAAAPEDTCSSPP
ncbi:unnamed protein product, partial [Bubo scandiacus]